jgi:hypothetical protein
MKASQVLDPEFVARLADAIDLDKATFWWCPKCKRPVIVAAERKYMQCRDFSHKPLQMMELENDLAAKGTDD